MLPIRAVSWKHIVRLFSEAGLFTALLWDPHCRAPVRGCQSEVCWDSSRQFARGVAKARQRGQGAEEAPKIALVRLPPNLERTENTCWFTWVCREDELTPPLGRLRRDSKVSPVSIFCSKTRQNAKGEHQQPSALQRMNSPERGPSERSESPCPCPCTQVTYQPGAILGRNRETPDPEILRIDYRHTGEGCVRLFKLFNLAVVTSL